MHWSRILLNVGNNLLMSCCLSLTFAIGLLVFVGCTPKAEETSLPLTSETIKQCNIEWTEPKLFAELIHEKVTLVSEEQLRTLIGDSNSSMALASGWERLIRSTMGKGAANNVQPDKVTIDRFLGLVEGRTGQCIPKLWEENMRSVILTVPRRPYFTFETGISEEDRSLVVEEQSTAKKEINAWIVQDRGQSWKLPAGTGKEYFKPSAQLAHDQSKSYLILYEWPPLPYKIYAFDNTRKMIWSSDVWAADHFTNYQGNGWHFVVLRIDTQNVIIFGISESVAYIEAFDKDTGLCAYRFCTAYQIAPDLR